MTRDHDPRLGPAEPTGFQWLDEPPTQGEAADAEELTTRCPRCGAVVGAQTFCESCGAPLPSADGSGAPPQEFAPDAGAGSVADGEVVSPEGSERPAGMLVLGGRAPLEGAVGGSAPDEAAGAPGTGLGGLGSSVDLGTQLPLPNGGICADCGGTFDGDGYCEQCGAKAADPRHHYEMAAGPWVGGVCDRGVRHPGNEDALALRAQPSPSGGLRAALVVCDGVSTAPRSARASLAAAQAAVEVLAVSRARGMGVKEALVGALGRRLEAAADAANEAVVAVGALPPDPRDEPPPYGDESGGPSCTLVAAAVEDGVAVIGNVGDSRAYWFSDRGEATLLTSDDSWAAEAIRAGASREEAESGPHAHTITRWLGPDAPDHAPVATALDVSEPGWLLLCSDGLWNYASEPGQLAAVLADALAEEAGPPAADRDAEGDAPDQATDDGTGGRGRAPDGDPVAVARRLVDWANAQGGHDNITVALARLYPDPTVTDPLAEPATTEHGGTDPLPEPGATDPGAIDRVAGEPGASGPVAAPVEERPGVGESDPRGVRSQERSDGPVAGDERRQGAQG